MAHGTAVACVTCGAASVRAVAASSLRSAEA